MPSVSEMVPLTSIKGLNTGLTSATEETMIAFLGSPQMPLTTKDSPDRASPLVKQLETLKRIAHVRANGIGPAVESLEKLLTKAFAAIPGLEDELRGDGMLVVRLRRPTSGAHSTKISNHAWGTAIDLALAGSDPPGATGKQVPYFIAALVPFFNEAGWYSGIRFSDDMHFEVADETVRAWAKTGKLGAPVKTRKPKMALPKVVTPSGEPA